MKRALSLLLVFAMIISCISMISFSAQAAESNTYLGNKFIFTEDLSSVWIRNSSAGISGLSDGNHSITYYVYNNGGGNLKVKLLLQSGWNYYNSAKDGTEVTIPAYSGKSITYNFTVANGLITGTQNSGAQSAATLRFEVKSADESGISVIPAGTELIIKYNKTDGTDSAKDLYETAETVLSEQVTKLPVIGKKFVCHTSAENNYFYTRANAGITEFVDGTHKLSYTVYNPNSYNIRVKFYMQNGWNSVDDTAGTERVIPAGTKAIFSYTYTVKDGAYFNAVATNMTIRFDVFTTEKGNGPIPADTAFYVEYASDPATDPLKNLKSLTLFSTTTQYTISDQVICPDYEFPYEKVVNGDVENGKTGWSIFNNNSAGSIELSTDTKTGTGSSIRLTAKNKYASPTFAVQAAIIQDDEALLNGAGAGKYLITFDAKADSEMKVNPTIGSSQFHKSAADIAGLLGGNATDYSSTWASLSGGGITLSTEWKTYTAVINISQKLYNTFKAAYAAGHKNAYKIDVRFDSSGLTYKDGTYTSYNVDNVSIRPYTESSTPVGVVYTATKDASKPYLMSSTAGGLFTQSDIVDGKITFKQYIFNESEHDLFFEFKFQLSTPGAWSVPTGAKSENSVVIEKKQGAWVEISVPVNSDNKVLFKEVPYDVSKLFIRFNFSGDVVTGTKFVLTCSPDIAEAIAAKVQTNGGFSAETTYDKFYAKVPEDTKVEVDPNFHVSGAFGSHMVLQRDALVPVWGISSYIGENVIVKFNGQTKLTTVKEDGTWSVTLDKMPANKKGNEMVITCNDKTQTLTDILVGDVFFVGGQSNAEKTLQACGDIYSAEYKQNLIASAEGNIRLFRQSKSDATADPTVMNSVQAEPVNSNVWAVETLYTASRFSAIGIFFAHKLYDELNVPIGMIMVCSGGSPLSQLMSKEASEEANYTRFENQIPVSGMYNALMAPFIKMSIKGMLFYQGESEMGLAISNYGKYNEYLKIYIEDLREKNGSNFPVFNVQLSSHVTTQWKGIAEQRAVQFEGLKMIDNYYLVVSMDQGFRSTDSDFAHPNYKKPVGDRLADCALLKLYGIGDENYVTSPIPVSAIKTSDGIVVTFKNVGDGLKRIGQHTTLSGFKAITSSGYKNVTATIISKNAVLLNTKAISGVTAVGYGLEELAFADYPEGNGDLTYVANLGNSNNLPSPTFKMSLTSASIIGAKLDVGSTLTVNYYANVLGEMEFVFGDETITVAGIWDNNEGAYKYAFTGINPQRMGDNLSASLYVDGAVIASKAEYSVEDYCNNLTTQYDDKALLTFLADMLTYGAEAQAYTRFNNDSPVNTADWVALNKTNDFTAPTGHTAIGEIIDSSCYISGASLQLTNTVRVSLGFNVKDWTNVTVSVKRNNEKAVTYTSEDLVNGNLYLDELTALQLGDIYTVTLLNGADTMHTVTYSAESYIANKYSNAEVGDLVKALYNYSVSAKALA